MGRCVLRCYIWGYYVCLCPMKRTPGLYGLIESWLANNKLMAKRRVRTKKIDTTADQPCKQTRCLCRDTDKTSTDKSSNRQKIDVTKKRFTTLAPKVYTKVLCSQYLHKRTPCGWNMSILYSLYHLNVFAIVLALTL